MPPGHCTCNDVIMLSIGFEGIGGAKNAPRSIANVCFYYVSHRFRRDWWCQECLQIVCFHQCWRDWKCQECVRSSANVTILLCAPSVLKGLDVPRMSPDHCKCNNLIGCSHRFWMDGRCQECLRSVANAMILLSFPSVWKDWRWRECLQTIADVMISDSHRFGMGVRRPQGHIRRTRCPAPSPSSHPLKSEMWIVLSPA